MCSNSGVVRHGGPAVSLFSGVVWGSRFAGRSARSGSAAPRIRTAEVLGRPRRRLGKAGPAREDSKRRPEEARWTPARHRRAARRRRSRAPKRSGGAAKDGAAKDWGGCASSYRVAAPRGVAPRTPHAWWCQARARAACGPASGSLQWGLRGRGGGGAARPCACLPPAGQDTVHGQKKTRIACVPRHNAEGGLRVPSDAVRDGGRSNGT
ncbi:MAG: hypothetical protein J3K34DRAFT_407212, partial [Monoraphidium minutum]